MREREVLAHGFVVHLHVVVKHAEHHQLEFRIVASCVEEVAHRAAGDSSRFFDRELNCPVLRSP